MGEADGVDGKQHWQIEGVLPLIERAKILRAAARALPQDTDLAERILLKVDDLCCEIGEKVVEGMEADDANA